MQPRCVDSKHERQGWCVPGSWRTAGDEGNEGEHNAEVKVGSISELLAVNTNLDSVSLTPAGQKRKGCELTGSPYPQQSSRLDNNEPNTGMKATTARAENKAKLAETQSPVHMAGGLCTGALTGWSLACWNWGTNTRQDIGAF